MVTAEALNIDSLFPASETIKICGEQLYILFQNFLNGVLPSVKQIRIKVAETLYQYINSTIDDDEDTNGTRWEL